MKLENFSFKNYSVVYMGAHMSIGVRRFIQKNHYKKSARSLKQKHVFGLFYEDLLVGVAVYGEPCGTKVSETYGGTKDTVLELRRFCLLNECPKNSESFFMGKTLRLLKQFNIKRVVSYSDPNKGHEGVIYKASNWTYVGVEKYRTPILMVGRKAVSVREMYQKNMITGEYKPAALEYQRLKVEGKARMVRPKAKHIFTYDIK